MASLGPDPDTSGTTQGVHTSFPDPCLSFPLAVWSQWGAVPRTSSLCRCGMLPWGCWTCWRREPRWGGGGRAPHLLQMFAWALGGGHSTPKRHLGVHPMGRGSVACGSAGLRPDGTGLAVWLCKNCCVVWKVFQQEYKISRSPFPRFPSMGKPWVVKNCIGQIFLGRRGKHQK